MTKSYIIWVILFGLLLSHTAQAQSDLTDSIQEYHQEYHKGQISAKDFLQQIDRLVDRQFEQGILFTREELTLATEPYKQIAWSADSLASFRINYYINLSNNANYANREGESVYFLEKAEQEVYTHYQQRSLMVAGRKCNTYWDKRNYKKVVDTYKEYADYLHQFPSLIKDRSINLNIGISYINVLLPVAVAYSHLQDTAQVDAIVQLAKSIHNEVTQIVKPQHRNMLTVNFYQHHLYFHQYFTLLDQQQESYQALEKMSTILHDSEHASNPIIGTLLPKLHTAKIQYFLHYNLNDSARYYLDKLKNEVVDFGSHYYTIHHFEANLLANQGEYEEAYHAAMAAARHIDSIQAVLVDDIDEMLYAHTAAEENRTLLLAAEKKERQRNIMVAVSISLALLAFLAFYTHQRRKNIKIRQQVTKLSQEANLQVSVLQEIQSNIRTEEQQKLAQDLHDNLAGTLASIKHNIAHMDNSSLSPAQQENLQVISSLLEKAYEQTRSKSHLLYEEGIIQQEDTYIDHLYKLVQTALPVSRYDTRIEIDKGTLVGTPIDLRINILRMVQEILTNIIKHAYAQRVNLSIYKEDNQLYIHVENDGKKFDLNKVKGKTFGIHSIRKRVKDMNGSIDIVSHGIGTETTIRIPNIEA